METVKQLTIVESAEFELTLSGYRAGEAAISSALSQSILRRANESVLRASVSYRSKIAQPAWGESRIPGVQGFEDGGLTDGCNARSRFAPSMRVGGGIILLSGSSTVRDDNK
jgi:hypothetical protein